MVQVFDLGERLINFATSIIELAEKLPATFSGRHLAGQVIRSGTAPALHYGEAQGGESRKDFIHKMKTALKELRETQNALKIVQRVKWLEEREIAVMIDENNQLISIFVKSIETATRNYENEKKLKKKPLRKPEQDESTE